jgi:long-chain acyl-CoA synthetase
LVLRKIRGAFGGRIRFFTSGSAPLSKEIAEFFHAVGLLILEGYGLTETAAASFVNRPDAFRFGTVGKALPGVEMQLADDGEIMIRCPGVMRSYRNRPDATAVTLKNGWLCTGDIGALDPDGFLRITDRKKDLIKTSGGKYIAPQSIEGQLRLACPLLSHVVVHGDGRNFCSALFTVDPVGCKNWAQRVEITPPADGDWASLPQLRKEVEAAVASVNSRLPSFETIKAFEILPADFTVATGELTTSMKVRRRFVEEKYRHVLDKFYEGAIRKL